MRGEEKGFTAKPRKYFHRDSDLVFPREKFVTFS